MALIGRFRTNSKSEIEMLPLVVLTAISATEVTLTIFDLFSFFCLQAVTPGVYVVCYAR